MKQVYYSDVSATPPSLPSTATEGYPQDGTVSGNAQATVPGAYWFYMISKELENVIQQGGLTPDASDLTQLSQVIANLTNNDRTMTAHASVVNASTAESICGADLDGLAPCRNYILDTNLTTSVGFQNLPVDNVGGVVVCWSRASTWQSGSAQMMYASNGKIYWRDYWGGRFRSWHECADAASVASAVANCVQGVSTTVVSGDLNDATAFPNNRIYAIANNEAVLNTPESGVGGCYIPLCRTLGQNSGSMCLYADFNGNLWYRYGVSAGWRGWHLLLSADAVTSVMQGKKQINATNMQEICDNDVNNLLPNSIYTVAGMQDLANTPTPGLAGMIMTMGRRANLDGGTSRLFFGFDGETYSSWYGGGVWQPWRRLFGQHVLHIVAMGDSICRGARNNYKGFAGNLRMPYVNLGQSGYLLSNHYTGRTPIADQLDSIPADFTPDIFIANGGINDYALNAPLGSPPTRPVDSDCSTACGGLQHMLYRMATEYPKAQRFFILTHRVKDWPTTENEQGYTETDLIEALRETCRIFATRVIDVFNESSLNTAFDVVRDGVICDTDGLHPMDEGYKLFYDPLIRQAIQTGTAK